MLPIWSHTHDDGILVVDSDTLGGFYRLDHSGASLGNVKSASTFSVFCSQHLDEHDTNNLYNFWPSLGMVLLIFTNPAPPFL